MLFAIDRRVMGHNYMAQRENESEKEFLDRVVEKFEITTSEEWSEFIHVFNGTEEIIKLEIIPQSYAFTFKP